MLYRLGTGLRARGQQTNGFAGLMTEINLTASFPAGFTYTRADAVATYRNPGGALAVAGNNAPRFDHDESGNALGLMVEPSRQNKCAAYNISPTELTGLTVSGNGSASVTIVDDSANLAARGLNVGNGSVIEIDNTLGGSGTAIVTIDGQMGNTNAHSMSCYMYVVTGALGTIGDSGGAGVVNGTDTTGYSRVLSENHVPSVSTRQMRLNAPFGCKVRFTLFQLEEGAFATSSIVVAGSAATRAQDRISVTNLSAAFGSAFNVARGTLALVARTTKITLADQYVGIFSDNSINNTIGLRLFTDGYVRPHITASSSVQSALSVNKIITSREFPMAITWSDAGDYKTVAGAGRRVKETGKTIPTSITRFDLGARYNAGFPFFGWIKKLVVADDQMSMSQLGALLVKPGARGIVSSGQSLIDNMRRSQIELDNTGELSFIGQLDTTWNGNVGNNWLIHGATGGSGVLYKNTTGGAWWYNDATAQWGDAWDTWEAAVQFFQGGGGDIRAVIWDGAQQDAGAVDLLGSDYTDVYNGFITVFGRMRGLIGSVPVLLMPTTGRTDSDLPGYQYLRELQWALAAALDYVHRGPETFDLPKADAIHLNSAGYTTSAARSSRKVLSLLGESIAGSVDGGSITGASRSGTSVTVTLAHDIGSTDFTPTSGIEGFWFYDNTTPISISAAVRTNATTITLTLASVPSSGIETLYFGYGNLYGVTYANIVHDNSSQAMPLRGAKISL